MEPKNKKKQIKSRQGTFQLKTLKVAVSKYAPKLKTTAKSKLRKK